MIPNLDAMGKEALMAFWKKYQQISRRKDCAELIGDRRKGYTTIAKDLGAYAVNKATAISCRLRGDIQAAQIYELICDSIYADLPEDCRW